MPSVAIPNTLFDVRAWLRAHPNFADLCPGRTFFRLPDNPANLPCMRLYRAGGGLSSQDSDIPEHSPRLSIEIWGNGPKQAPLVTQIQQGLEDACWQIQSPTLINPAGNTILTSATFNTGFDSPDPDTGWPRSVCDVTISALAKTPTVIS